LKILILQEKMNKNQPQNNNADNIDYRQIAKTMSALGFKMKHSSVRNYVIRLMKRFVEAYTCNLNVTMTDEQMTEIAKSPEFQKSMSEILAIVEDHRKHENVTGKDTSK